MPTFNTQVLNVRAVQQESPAPLATIAVLRFYKKWLSPLLGQNCRFHPSCSDYARVSLARFGTMRGLWLTTWRIGRCQPLCRGGIDHVPQTFRFWPVPSHPPASEPPDE